MMMLEPNKFIDSYLSWLKENTTALSVRDNVVEINSPFLDRHNDYIQIYVIKDEDGYLLSDDGYIINDLDLSGFRFNTPKRKEELNKLLVSFGVKLNTDGAIQVHCNQTDFASKKHNLMQAMIAINDLFVLSTPNISSVFTQDVEDFLQENDIRYTRNVNFRGKSGFDHAYDFVVPQSKTMPDRLIKAVNNLDRTVTQTTMFSWSDTIQVRSADTKLYTFVNDVNKNVSATCVDALKEYGIIPVIWSAKTGIIKELIA